MTVFPGIFLSEGTPEGRGRPQEPPAGPASPRKHGSKNN